jgi:hypothetical protein
MPDSDAGPPVELTVDTAELQQFARMLANAAEPAKLRRQLAKELRGALQPAVAQAKSAIVGGLSHTTQANPSPALGPSIARNVKAEVRLSGRVTGARVKVKKTRNVRGFPNAPKLTNRDGWRHRVYGKDIWVEQIGRPGWFDDALNDDAPKYRAAVMRVLQDWAQQMSRGR